MQRLRVPVAFTLSRFLSVFSSPFMDSEASVTSLQLVLQSPADRLGLEASSQPPPPAAASAASLRRLPFPAFAGAGESGHVSSALTSAPTSPVPPLSLTVTRPCLLFILCSALLDPLTSLQVRLKRETTHHWAAEGSSMLGSDPASLPCSRSSHGSSVPALSGLAFQALLAWSSSHKHTDQAICSETLPQTLPSLSPRRTHIICLPPTSLTSGITQRPQPHSSLNLFCSASLLGTH